MPKERVEKIILFLKNHNIATVEQLVKVTDSSPATIRRDLIKLSEEGTILRAHGGVSLNQFILFNRQLMKSCQNRFWKKSGFPNMQCH